jgi:hypothetical protein
VRPLLSLFATACVVGAADADCPPAARVMHIGRLRGSHRRQRGFRFLHAACIGPQDRPLRWEPGFGVCVSVLREHVSRGVHGGG